MCSVSVIPCFWAGDILGRALKNLDGLLQMPYGCGEQNMALLAPNIYILEYLRNTQQLTPAIREKATNFLTSGESPFTLVAKRTRMPNLPSATFWCWLHKI